MLRHAHLFAALAVLAIAAPAVAAGHDDADDAPVSTEPFTRGDAALRQIRDRLLRDYYRADITEADLDRAAAQGMLSFVDAKLHGGNKLLSPEEYAELQRGLKGEAVGAGVMIDFDASTGLVAILDVIPHSPAAAADLRSGDRILAIDGKAFQGKQLRDVGMAMRGPEGSSVTLSILRGAQVLQKTLTRKRITFEPVQTTMLPDGVMLLAICAFGDTTPTAVRHALQDALAQHAHAVIIDLRDNPGGELERSVETAQLLVPKGKLITSVDERGGKVERFVSKADAPPPELPVAVLVNGDTRCSAELVAAALRQDLGAPLIGTRTYGKWSVQQLEALPNGYAIRYTVGLITAPDGQSYEGRGMPPDIEVQMDSKDYLRAELAKNPADRLAADAQLRAAYNLLRLHE